MTVSGFLFEGERELPYPINKIILHKGMRMSGIPVRVRVSLDDKTNTMEMWIE